MDNRLPRLEIVEQPQQRGMRFRYECEGRSAGSIPGENTTADKKTWPACQVVNYSGLAVMRVSLVSKDDPPRPHPHSLVGRDCDKGVCQTNLDPSNQMLGTFPNLGIQCVRRREVNAAIVDRIRNNVNPFSTVLEGDERSSVDVDLNIVRLCFEAFLPDHNGHYTHKLNPVVSNPIYDKKATCAGILKICRVDKTHGSAQGHDEVFLLCDKVQKEDIQVVFSKGNWEALADFSSVDVHRQVAIVFRTPAYKDPNIQESVEVEFKLRRPSDKQVSKSLQFTYLPMQHEGKHKIFPNMPTPSSSNDGRIRIRRAIEDKYKASHNRLFQRAKPPPSRPAPVPTTRWQPSFLPATTFPDQQPIKQEPFLSGTNMPPWQSPFPQTSFIPSQIQSQPNLFEPTPNYQEPTFQANLPGTSGLIGLDQPQQTFTNFLNGGDPMKDEDFPSVGVEMTDQILQATDLDELIDMKKLSIDFEHQPNPLANTGHMSITENILPQNMTSPNQQTDFRPPQMPNYNPVLSPPSGMNMMSPHANVMSPHANVMSPTQNTMMSPQQTPRPLHHTPNNINPLDGGFGLGGFGGNFHTNNNNNLFNYDTQQQAPENEVITNFLKTLGEDNLQ